jgi:hypothetical protein
MKDIHNKMIQEFLNSHLNKEENTTKKMKRKPNDLSTYIMLLCVPPYSPETARFDEWKSTSRGHP